MRYLGLDLGTKTLGLSISDKTLTIASSYKTIRYNEYEELYAELKKVIEEFDITKMILGYPKNMNNTVGERALKSLEFKEMLERRTGLPVVMWDERLTTVEANRTLMESGVRRENRKQYLDELAAIFILQSYLDAYGREDAVREVNI